jgi:hypothetical protein
LLAYNNRKQQQQQGLNRVKGLIVIYLFRS